MSATDPEDFTLLLHAVSDHDRPEDHERLWNLVYGELRAFAARLARGERPSATLQPTALVNEVYLRLFGHNASPSWDDRRHFFGAALRAMRQLLIDRSRRSARQRNQAGLQVTLAPDLDPAAPPPTTDASALSDALDALEQHDSRVAQVVMLRFFAGLTQPDIARTLGVSLPTIKRDWAYGRSWLYARLQS